MKSCLIISGSGPWASQHFAPIELFEAFICFQTSSAPFVVDICLIFEEHAQLRFWSFAFVDDNRWRRKLLTTENSLAIPDLHFQQLYDCWAIFPSIYDSNFEMLNSHQWWSLHEYQWFWYCSWPPSGAWSSSSGCLLSIAEVPATLDCFVLIVACPVQDHGSNVWTESLSL